jgi:hypothetical protein
MSLQRRRKTLLSAVLLACVGALGLASQASAAVTIGQNPLSTPSADCKTQLDLVQPSVTSATRYVVPSTIAQGTITSWSHRASAGSGQTLSLKVFRGLGGPAYEVIGQDGPRSITASRLNTFDNVSIPVQAGDVLGLNSGNAAAVANGCLFDANGDRHLEAPGDLGIGGSAAFTTVPGTRVNVSAKVEPANTFNFGATFRNRKRGLAVVQVFVPNPGTIRVVGDGVTDFVHGSIRIAGPGPVNLVIGATGRKLRKLNRRGRVFVAASFRYTPTSGERSTLTPFIKLKKKRRKR